jgi:hypothetical protein
MGEVLGEGSVLKVAVGVAVSSVDVAVGVGVSGMDVGVAVGGGRVSIREAEST